MKKERILKYKIILIFLICGLSISTITLAVQNNIETTQNNIETTQNNIKMAQRNTEVTQNNIEEQIDIAPYENVNEIYENAETTVFDNTNVSVDFSEGYTNDLIYNENYDYSLGYDEEDNFETMSLEGVVVEASEAFEYSNGYDTSIAQKLKVKITDSRHNGEIYNIIYYLEDDYNTRLPLYDELKENDKVYVYANFEDDVLVGDAFVQYYDKTNWVILLAGIFALIIVLIGGVKGIKALVGLIITVGLVFGMLVPGILNGDSPIMLTVIVCCLTIFFTFIIVSGFHKKTFAAILGTIAGVVAAGTIGSIFSDSMMLTGINEHARMLSVSVAEEKEMFDFKGIMLAGIMISALGACMDVGMSIASSLSELKNENPEMTTSKLIKSGMNIGKDVMGTMTNTLILAYVGSAMLCILLYTINGFDLATVLNQEDITMEVLKSLAGSIGLVCTIPLTALVSGLIMGDRNIKNKKNKAKKYDDGEVKIKYFNG